MEAKALAWKPGPRASLATSLLWVGGYVAVVAYFASVDVYNVHFFDASYAPVYNLLRVAFAVYLFWIVYVSGRVLVAATCGDMPDCGPVEAAALGFFAGAAVWTLVMLALGYLGLYTRSVAVLLTVPIVAASSPHFLRVMSAAVAGLRAVRPRHAPDIVAALITAAAAALLLVVKGLYPAGGHDYFTHYFHYFTTVLDNHNIWPNDVWYHYYYSKGVGLTFLGMLLTDPLAPSVVTFCFAAAAALALFAFTDRCNPGTLWPWAAVTLFVFFYVYTPGTGLYKANGGWADFQKPHETSSAFVIALPWMAARLIGGVRGQRSAWWLGAALCTFALALVTTLSAVVAGLFWSLMAASFLVVRGRDNAIAFLGLAVVAGLGLILVLTLNYLTSGLPLDNGIELFWPILDLRRLHEWGALAEVVTLMATRLAMWRSALPIVSDDMQIFLANTVRAEVLWFPLLLTAAAAAIIGAAAGMRTLIVRAGRAPSCPRRGIRARCLVQFGTALALLIATLIVALVVGRAQPVSFVRYSSFMLALMIGLIVAAWQLLTAGQSRWAAKACAVALPLVVVASSIAATGPSYRESMRTVAASAVRFVKGSASIFDAYVDQSGWPGRLPDGAIRPWTLAIWKEIGPGTRFRTFGIHTYCMLPHCRPERGSAFVTRTLDVLFGSPTEAREILQHDGLDYFLIEMDGELSDPFMCAPLFSPDTMKEYLGIRWTDGRHFLLTWLGAGIAPLTPAQLEGFRAKLAGARCGWLPLLRALAEQLTRNPRWGADLDLPWPNP